MKKIKIMLFSIAIFAIVGVALAFKAKGPVEICTAEPNFDGPVPTCPDACTNFEGFGEGAPIFVCYTTPEDGPDPCPDDLDCEITPDFFRIN